MAALPGGAYTETKLRFYTFHHPYVCDFLEALGQRNDADRLLTTAMQSRSLDSVGIIPPNMFAVSYRPTSLADSVAHPTHDVDFDLRGSYSQYNWELFFHIPLFIANLLMQDQRHEEAMRWFHYVFNPLTDDQGAVPGRYWNFKPFRELGVPERIQDLLLTLQDPKADETKKAALVSTIEEWRQHPFQPHRIARARPGAYMKNVVMKYLDNIIAWGDKLFRRDTIESINEATQLYILAANLLQLRPHHVPPVVEEKASTTYSTLRPTLDALSNAMVQVETASPFTAGSGSGGSTGSESLLGLATLAFCIPANDKLLGYWDTVEDRLFKIRHCMNIEGVVRELPLFEPPIDPALLVRAAAMGLDLGQVLDDLSAPLPHYRFPFMLQKAREFCEELKQIGSLLLAVLEKRDAERLAQLRATHERDLLKAVRDIQKQQVKDAEEAKAALQIARRIAETRQAHYTAISNRLAEEKQFLSKQKEAVVYQIASQMAALLGSTAAAAPDLTYVVRTGTASAAGTDTKVGGGSTGAAIANLVSTYLGWLGQVASLEGTTASYKGELVRAQQDRDLQVEVATLDMAQIDRQLAAAEIRLRIAEQELANHEKQIEQAEEIESVLREKFTNQEMYAWMVSQASSVYFQSYKLVFDLGKRAERACRHELGLADSSFVRFGAWDSLRKGLLAAERLSLDLRRLEHAYLDKNRREYELTKHISLRQLNPIALLTLKAAGRCEVSIPEWIFDMDAPGHYMRRIKSVALSIPSVVGPYTGVNCTLALVASTLRTSASLKNGKYERQGPNDDRLMNSTGPVQSIITSGASNDSGLFETNLRDERFLPFEGAGAESTWRLDLPKDYRPFDYNTISDVVLHMRYTARPGVDPSSVKSALADVLQPATSSNLALLFSLRHDFPSEWSAFVNGTGDFTATIRRDDMPYFTQGRKITVVSLELYDGMDVTKHHLVNDTAPTAATDGLNTKQAFTFIAAEDKTEDATNPAVMRRDADTQVFLIIHYRLSAAG
jgi:hypothetical protein